jgi:hypothetical protein
MSELEQGTGRNQRSSVLSQALQNRIGAVQCSKGYEGSKGIRCGQTVCCDHLGGGRMSTMNGKKEEGKEEDLYVWVALHNLLYSGQRQGRVTIVGSLLLCCIDLSLPEGVEELVKGLS